MLQQGQARRERLTIACVDESALPEHGRARRESYPIQAVEAVRGRREFGESAHVIVRKRNLQDEITVTERPPGLGGWGVLGLVRQRGFEPLTSTSAG